MNTNNIFKLIVILLLPLALLLTTVEMVTFDSNYFDEKYEEYNISKETGIHKNDLTDITEKILSYLRDDTNNLNIQKEINGTEQEVFGEREKLHMIDVKELFIKGNKIRNISITLVAISLIVLIIKGKRNIGKTLVLSSIISVTLIALLSLLMYTNFNKYFTYFHEIFFKNDLWLLNPKTDVLIQMLPLGFFYSIATKIAIIFILELLIITTIGLVLNKCYKISIRGKD